MDIYYDTTGNFSALTPYKVVAGAYNPTVQYSTWDALNTARYQAFTASEAATCTGAIVVIKNQSATGTDTITVQLQEYIATVWTDVAGATKTLTVNDIAGAHNTVKLASPAWVSFIFTTPKAITNAASTWRIKVSSSTNQQGIYQTYGYAILTNTATTYTSGDNILVKDGVIITQDQSITATNLILGVNCHWLVPSTVASSLSLNVTNFWLSKDVRLAIGEGDTNRVPYANQFFCNITNWKPGEGYQGGQNFEVEMWGEKPTSYFTTLSANAAAAQKVIVTTDDMSAAWVGTDSLVISGYNSTTVGYEVGTINTISGTSITLVGNLAAIHFSKWAVINTTRAVKCGIKTPGFLGSSPNYNGWAVAKFSGVNHTDANPSLFVTNAGSTADNTRVLAPYVDTYICSAGGHLTFQGFSVSTLGNGGTYKNILVWNGGNSQNHLAVTPADVGATFSDIYMTSLSGTHWGYNIDIAATNATLTNIQCSGRYTTGYQSARLNLINSTVTGLKIGGGIYSTLTSVACTFNNCTFDNETYGLYVSTAIETTFNNCAFGTDAANATNEVWYVSATFDQIVANNCTFSSEVKAVGNITNAVLGSYFRAQTYGTTTNNHISWWKYGKMQSTGTGLTDTTAHTAGGLALRLEPLSSVSNLPWTFTVPVGNIQNRQMMVGCWVNINTATYYAGTYQLPRLNINYDNGTTAYAQVSQQTGWQFIFVAFTPVTTYGQITVTVNGKTDATGTNSYFYVDDFSVLYPAGYQLNLGAMDLWANALPITPPIATNLSALDVWTASSTVSYGANTMGSTLISAEQKADDATALILSK